MRYERTVDYIARLKRIIKMMRKLVKELLEKPSYTPAGGFTPVVGIVEDYGIIFDRQTLENLLELDDKLAAMRKIDALMANPGRGGRPKALSPSQVAQARRMRARGAKTRDICAKLGVSKTTLHREGILTLPMLKREQEGEKHDNKTGD